ncbi:MAG TPA: CoA transferase [Trebonia sp.]|jgi:crotonobetainyl-CoA:carnitine CoA-transferase CaiB-like acyl-CoA transferase|nr:CoA transferase [Trebonia sp.]
MSPAARVFLADLGAALGIDVRAVEFTGAGALGAPYAMTDLGAACLAGAGAAVAGLVADAGHGAGDGLVTVDRLLTTGLFHRSSRPLRAATRSPFHPMSRDFPTADGRWVRFQANYPRLRAATLAVLGAGKEGAWDGDGDGDGDEPGAGDEIAAIVAGAKADELEAAVVAGGGAAAASRTVGEWAVHHQGAAVAAEPLVDITQTGRRDGDWRPVPERPLAGIRVLDMTRVLAGPMATRLLAGFGAQVLRLDPPDYDEPNGIGSGDLTLGKRCAELDLKTADGKARFAELLAGADLLVHGLRPGALDALGLDAEVRQAISPGLSEVTLNAYGWTGPWRGRRGFDTLVQNSTGMALAGGAWAGTGVPYRWPLSIIDHSAGYLMAAAAVAAVTRRARTGHGSVSRVSLARVAYWLTSGPAQDDEARLDLPLAGPLDRAVYDSPVGPVRRLRWPMQVTGIPFRFDRPGDPFRSSVPCWIG